MFAARGRVGGRHDRKVGLWLAAIPKGQRELREQLVAGAELRVKALGELLDRVGVGPLPRAHRDDHSFQQLDALVVVEDAGVDHAVVVAHP